tara:strand:+ start:1727 stop:2518 length:792 start_codon:yes stop_codon:yes gene_type:complete
MDDWKAIARSLGIGQKRKVVCCGSSPSAYVSQDIHGIRFGPCFRCGHREYEKHEGLSAKQVMAMRSTMNSERSATAVPKRCVSLVDGTSNAHLWVLGSGLSPEEANDVYGFRFDPYLNRVVLPLSGGYLSRRIENDKSPKYILHGNAEHFTLQGKTPEYTLQGKEPCVVVEDIISAIKVNRAGFSVTAILGTSIGATLGAVLSEHPLLICWTDGDKAGDDAYVKLRKSQRLYETAIRRVRTELDPKHYSKAEIRRYIDEATGS